MGDDIVIRWATEVDYDQLGDVMFDAVRNGHSFYNEAQRMAWVREPRRGTRWAERLATQAIILQENISQIDGFMSLTSEHYIDFAYIRPNAQGTGLFRKLYMKIERKAQIIGATRLWTHANLMAQPAFLAMGFDVQKNEEVKLNGQYFKRALMEKELDELALT